MRTRRRLLWCGLATAFMAVMLVRADAPVGMRLLFGLPLVMLVPGYGLIEALDPVGRLRAPERLAIALAGSVSLTAVSGLLLAASPAGLGAMSWSAGLGWLSVVATLLGLHRTRQPAMRTATATSARRRSGLAAAAVFLLMSGTALAMVIAGETLGSEQNVEQGDSGILQLWAIPTTSGDLKVGFENPTDTAMRCTLRVHQGPVLVSEQELLLAPGTETLTIQPPERGSVMFPLEIVLLDENGATVLRRVSVWMHLAGSGITHVDGAEG